MRRFWKKGKTMQPTILDCGHVDTGAGCETIGCPNVRIDPSWDHVDDAIFGHLFCMNRSPLVDGAPFICTQPYRHKGWHIAEGWTDPLRAWPPEGGSLFILERVEL